MSEELKTERELLELAAKAAGYKLDGLASRFIAQGVGLDDLLRVNESGGHSVWNPLNDDGDDFLHATCEGLASKFSIGHSTLQVEVGHAEHCRLARAHAI